MPPYNNDLVHGIIIPSAADLRAAGERLHQIAIESSRESRNCEHLEQGPELLLGQNDVRFAFTKLIVSERL
jgi:hypothetical protein